MLLLLQDNIGTKAVNTLQGVVEGSFLCNYPVQWILFGLAWFGMLAVFSLLRRVMAGRLKKIAVRTSTRFDDVIVKVIEDQRTWLYFFIFLYVASLTLNQKPETIPTGTEARLAILLNILGVLRYIAIVVAAIQLFLSSRLVVDFALEQLLDKTKSPDGKPDPSIRGSLVVLRFVVMLVVATGVCLLALENFGVKIGPMITGLGIGGIAVALAIQKVLGDLLASVSILMDKPFVVGDYVQVGDKSGTVEVIGLKTTRMRAPTGEQLIFGNSDILSSRIHNYERIEERRVTINLNVAVSVPAEKLQRVPEIVKSLIDQEKQLRFDRCHLKLIGERAYVYEVSYLVLSSDYKAYMDALQRVNLGIIQRLAQEDIKMFFF
jgi:small-conductance mechanosensitive channel